MWWRIGVSGGRQGKLVCAALERAGDTGDGTGIIGPQAKPEAGLGTSGSGGHVEPRRGAGVITSRTWPNLCARATARLTDLLVILGSLVGPLSCSAVSTTSRGRSSAPTRPSAKLCAHRGSPAALTSARTAHCESPAGCSGDSGRNPGIPWGRSDRSGDVLHLRCGWNCGRRGGVIGIGAAGATPWSNCCHTTGAHGGPGALQTTGRYGRGCRRCGGGTGCDAADPCVGDDGDGGGGDGGGGDIGGEDGGGGDAAPDEGDGDGGDDGVDGGGGTW
eukprot:gene12952-biopygen4981